MTVAAQVGDPFAGRPRSGPPKQWSIATLAGASWRELAPLRAPSLTAAAVHGIDAAFVADPFLERDGGVWRLLFEMKNAESGRGEIALATSSDAITWASEGVVLAEPFHLSYPHLVHDNGDVWMTPESIGAEALLLYRGTPDRMRWTRAATLLDGVWADPTPFRHDGLWWMFACPRPMRHDALCLFVAERLTGPWRAHPRSPLIVGDASRCRPAGPVRMLDGVPVRFAQDCVPAYGTGVRAFAITRLTPHQYEEREITSAVLPRASGAGWNRDGSHHIDLHRDGERWLAVIDGYTTVPEEPPEIATLSTVAEIDAIAGEWDAMLDVCDAHPVFSSPVWFRAALRDGARPHVVIARRQRRITAIVPLVVRGDAPECATPLSDYNDVIAFDAETAAQVIRAAGAPLALRGIRAGSVTAAACANLTIETHCRRIALPRSFDDYLASRSRPFRKSLLRAQRAAARAGFAVVRLEHDVVDRFLELHAARWGDRGRLAAPHAAALLRDALPPLLACGRVRAYALVRGSDVAAIDLALISRDALASWNGGFRADVAHLSPGSLLFAAEIEDAIASGLRSFDMLRGAHPYKSHWTDDTEPLYCWNAPL